MARVIHSGVVWTPGEDMLAAIQVYYHSYMVVQWRASSCFSFARGQRLSGPAALR